MRSRIMARLTAGVIVASSAHCVAEPVYITTGGKGVPHYTNQPMQNGSKLLVIFPGKLARQTAHSVTIGAKAERAPQAHRVARSDTASVGRPVIDALIRLAAGTHDIEEALLRAVITVESGFNPAARSARGAMGLMQLMPATARRYGVTDAHDPGQNIDGGARYLKDLLRMFGGNVKLALAAYNAGEGSVIRHGRSIPPFAETRAFVPAVLAHYRRYSMQPPSP